MSEYLLISKGRNHYYSVGRWYHSLKTAKELYKRVCALSIEAYPELFVLERKYLYGGVYRLKKLIENKWVNSKWIDTTEEEYAKPLIMYVEENMDEFVSYREKEIEEWGEAPSIAEWVNRNEMAVREFIFWLYDKAYISEWR